ncbi:putative transposition-like protein [Oxalobacteraceae bacterium IMCC9480]|nr:putative transposition-like protein [Oxalobacteraceae bacterium IMCC9480]
MAAKIETALAAHPFDSRVFVFRGRRGNTVKLLSATEDGLCLLAKRLKEVRFVWPQATSGSVCLTPAQLLMLLEGINWRQPQH